MKKIDNFNISYFKKRLIDWGRVNFKDFPWRRTKNKWHYLVAEIMLQRTKADQVEPVYLSFVRSFPT